MEGYEYHHVPDGSERGWEYEPDRETVPSIGYFGGYHEGAFPSTRCFVKKGNVQAVSESLSEALVQRNITQLGEELV